MFAAAREPILAAAASLLAGAAWIIMLTTLFVSAQIALPEWVRGRGLAIYLTVYFGAMTAGSAIWGKIASLEGIPDGALHRRRRRFPRTGRDLGPEAAERGRARPVAGDALAPAGVRAAGR